MKERILGIITGIFYLIFLISSTAVDSESKIPIIICGISILWFAFVVFINRDQLGPLEEYEEYEEEYEEDSDSI